MHRKIALGAFAVCLSAGLAQAQTSATDPAVPDPAATAPSVDLVVPEGFTLQTMPLTAEELLGANIYDISGDSIGEVHDLVFAAPDAGTTDGAATMPGTTEGSATPEATAPSTGTDTGTAADGTAPDTGTADTGTADMGTADTGTAADGTAPDATAAPDAGTADTSTAPDATTAPDTGTDTGTAADGTMPETTTSPDTGTVDTGAAADTTAPDATTTAPDMGATGGTAAADGTAGQSGQITHAILDIGGFLGMGQHRIALPVSDLRIYRSDSDLRVYLPWTREQMTALPEYDENDPATLGRPLMTP